MLIYDRYTSTTGADSAAVGNFLRTEYEKETVGFPGYPPAFVEEAAVWAAGIVFNAAQLLLLRASNEKDVEQLLAAYPAAVDAGAILSADLCLRCLPDVIAQTSEITPDDPLIPLLEGILWEWHYSGVGYFNEGSISGDGVSCRGKCFDWAAVLANDCLRRLYVDRVISRRATALANDPVLRSDVRAALGDHGARFWKEL